MRKSILTTTVLVLTAGVLAACSSGDDADGDSVAGASVSATATTGGAPATSASAPVTGSGAPLTKAQTRAVLLTVKDMPSGWASTPFDDSESDDEYRPRRCDELSEDIGGFEKVELHSAGATFNQGGDFGANLSMEVTTHSEVIDVDVLAAAQRELLDSCATMTSVWDGVPVDVALGEMSFPALGDASHAMRMTMSANGMSFTGDVVVVVEGHNALVFSTAGVVPVPSAEFEQFVRSGLANLDEVTSGGGAAA